jgi:hypothetical protein
VQHERDAAQEAAAAERAKAEELANELARVKARGFWARLFGGAGKPYISTRPAPAPTT